MREEVAHEYVRELSPWTLSAACEAEGVASEGSRLRAAQEAVWIEAGVGV